MRGEIRREALEREISAALGNAYASPYWNDDGREGARSLASYLVQTFDLSLRVDRRAITRTEERDR